jgi:hypothetical protein
MPLTCTAQRAAKKPNLIRPARIEIKIELGSIAWTPAAAIEFRTLLDGQRHMMDIAFDLR